MRFYRSTRQTLVIAHNGGVAVVYNGVVTACYTAAGSLRGCDGLQRSRDCLHRNDARLPRCRDRWNRSCGLFERSQSWSLTTEV